MIGGVDNDNADDYNDSVWHLSNQANKWASTPRRYLEAMVFLLMIPINDDGDYDDFGRHFIRQRRSTIVSIHHGGQYAGEFYGDVDGKCDGNTYPIKQINAMVQPYKGEIHWK